eukprot:6212323-Pleurochrysis_carterae.AAC.2
MKHASIKHGLKPRENCKLQINGVHESLVNMVKLSKDVSPSLRRAFCVLQQTRHQWPRPARRVVPQFNRNDHILNAFLRNTA